MTENTYDQMLDYHAFQAQLPELLENHKVKSCGIS